MSSYQIVARGKKGTLQFRKQVPADIQRKLNKREWTKSLGTTNPYDAELKARELDLGYERLIRTLRSEASPLEDITTSSHHLMQQLSSAKLHSYDEPKLSNFSTTAEFLTAHEAWTEDRKFMMKLLVEDVGPVATADEVLNKGFSPVVHSLANELQGQESGQLHPTFAEIVDLYFSEKNDKAIGKSDEQKQNANQKTRSHLKWIARYLGDGDEETGWATTIDKITRQRVLGYRDWWLSRNPGNGNSSYNKPVSNANAVFNVAIKKLGLERNSPFSGMKLPEGKSPRKAFTPDQFQLLQQRIQGLRNSHPEAYFVGRLMIATGCRTSEAVGLSMADVKLNDDIPHVWFRSNTIRGLNKGDHDRPFPLEAELVEEFRGYLRGLDNNQNPNDAVFPNNAFKKAPTNQISERHMKIVRKYVSNDPNIVMYSARHVFTTRAYQAGVDNNLASYLVGHRPPGMTAIHANYIHGDNLLTLKEAVDKANNIREWGYEWSEKDAF